MIFARLASPPENLCIVVQVLFLIAKKNLNLPDMEVPFK